MSTLSQCPRSPAAAPPLEDDDLLSEILLHLPPLPSSLLRVSLVCKRWRCLVFDPGFVRRFRRNRPPLLGFFGQGVNGYAFQSTMDPPNCVPPSRFSMPSDARVRLKLLGCRHGLILMLMLKNLDQKLKHVLVWDPVTGDQHDLAVTPAFDTERTRIVGAVLRAVGDAHHFHVVLARLDKQQQRALACMYSSEIGVWSDLISTQLPYVGSTSSLTYMFFKDMHDVLVGDSLYWKLYGMSPGFLEFDLDKHSLAVIHLPVYMLALSRPWDFTVMQAEDGGLGLLFMSDLTAQLWKRNTDCDGVAPWVLRRTIELDNLVFLNSDEERKFLLIVGFAEYNNVVFLCTAMGLFMFHLESLQLKKISKPNMVSRYHPFESVYVAGNSVPLHCGQ